MNYLLDVNVLLAWGWEDHQHHRAVATWLNERLVERGAKILTSSIPELGFVRVSIQQSGGEVSPAEACEVLGGLVNRLGKRHLFLADDESSTGNLHDWCQGAKRTTDSHLLKLAEKHGARLVTLDQGIPGALLISP